MNARRISNGLTRAHSKDITDGRIKLQGFVYINLQMGLCI